MENKNLAIIGKDSFLGRHLFSYFKENGNFNVIGTSYKDLDITKEELIKDFLKFEKPDYIILLAGIKDVKKLETEPDFAEKINVLPTKYFAKHIKELGLKTKYFFMSSDYVFDGAKGCYKDTDTTCPTTVYGKNKQEVEEFLSKSGIDYTVVRTAAVLGKGSVFFSWLLEELKDDKEVEMFAQSYFSPTSITFLCKSIEKIIQKNPDKKILNVTNGKRISRYDLAKLVQNYMKSSPCKIKPFENKFKDLSLVPSDFILEQNLGDFESFLKTEIENCL